VSDVSMLRPRTEGYFLFSGVRHSRPGYVEMVCEPVQIVEVLSGKQKELAVTMFGRGTKWRLDTFEGTWREITTGGKVSA